MTTITDDELYAIRDVALAIDTPPAAAPDSDIPEQFDTEIGNRAERIASLCEELLMFRAAVRLVDGKPGEREAFLAMAPHIKLPLRIGEDGLILDATGMEVACVDFEREHTDDATQGLQAMIVLAMNACAIAGRNSAQSAAELTP